MFSGPAARSVPTSTSTFRMRARSRGELERMSRDLERERDEREEREEEEDAKSMGGRSRRSRKSGKGKGRSKRRSSRRGSDATSVGGTTDAGESDGESLAPSSRGGTPRLKDPGTPSRRPHRPSRPSSPTSSDDERPGFFQGISDAIRGRRPSVSQYEAPSTPASRVGSRSGSRAGSVRPKSSRRRSSEYESDAVSVRSESEIGDDDDPYGPYGSSDSTSTATTLSSSSQDDGPRRRRGGGGFPGMPGTGDMFGESRISFDDGSDDESGMGSPGGRKGSVNAQQALYIPDEDLHLRLVGLRVSGIKSAVWTTGCVLSGGTLWLLGRWVPNIWLKSVGRPGEFDKASYVVIEARPRLPSLKNVLIIRILADTPPPSSNHPHRNPHPSPPYPPLLHLPSLSRQPSFSSRRSPTLRRPARRERLGHLPRPTCARQ